MTEALYRTYRPKTFGEVVNQQHIRITLQNALQQHRVAHAYLFAGPRGVGKTSLARILARAVNCTALTKDGEPCNRCQSCQALLTNRSLDVVEIDAASQTGVDNVRENIIQSARAIPAMAQMKVFIIDEVHMLSTSAFNALLKLLEEPPAHAMFILATTEVHRIPETIISRTQRFDFKKISVADIADRLQALTKAEQRQLDQVVAERIARRAGGSIRDAESMLGQLFSFDERRITSDVADLVLPRSDQQLIWQVLTAVIDHQATVALDHFHRFCDEGGDLDHFVEQCVHTGRALLLTVVNAQLPADVSAEFDSADAQLLLDLGRRASPTQVTKIIEEFMTAARLLNRAVMAELPIELAIIKSAMSDVTPIAMTPTATTGSPKQVSPPTAPTRPVAKKNSRQQLTLEAVAEAWTALQRQIGQTQPSLGLSVQHATIAGLDGQEIIVHAPFKLQADRLSDPKNNRVLVEALTEKLGQPVSVSVSVAAATAVLPPSTTAPAAQRTSKATASDLWEQVVSSFGDA